MRGDPPSVDRRVAIAGSVARGGVAHRHRKTAANPGRGGSMPER
jgi:hypothetical protein